MRRIAIACLLAVLVPASATKAAGYLQKEDEVLLRDGKKLIGSIVFCGGKMVVIIVRGREIHLPRQEVTLIRHARATTGGVAKMKVKEEAKKVTNETGRKAERKRENKDGRFRSNSKKT